MIADIPTYLSTPTLQASCPDEIKYDIVGKIVEELAEDGYDVVTFDNNPKAGGRIEHPDGWGLIRASSNLPVLVMRFEAKSKEKLEELQALVKSKMDKYDEIGKTWESG